jgi:glycosyltransferase involved in cell wall biosynthesis
MDGMRIALIAPPWVPVPPPLYGGTESVVHELAVGYQQAGHEVLLFTTADSTCPVPMASAAGQVDRGRIGLSMPELRHVMAAYETVADFDIIHDHTELGPVYSVGRTRGAVVTTVHNPLDATRLPVYERIARDVNIVLISNAQRRAAGRLRISRVIHHGVDPSAYPVGSGDGDYVLFLGRMSPDKGVHRALEAAFKAGVPLVVAAKMRTREEHEYFDACVRPYLNDDLRYIGEVHEAEKLQLLAGARALLNPIQWNEPFGLVMIEAMACGTPVLAFAAGAAPEIVSDGHTGFLCRDEADMAEAIARVHLIDRAACRAVVDEYFSADRMVEEYLALFDDLRARR